MLVQTVEDAERLELPSTDRIAYSTQTTLSVDETADIVATCGAASRSCASRRRATSATRRRTGNARSRDAAAGRPPARDRLRNSSNSNRLVEVGRAAGVESHLIDDETGIDVDWLVGRESIGITSGASAPESLVAGSATGSARTVSPTSARSRRSWRMSCSSCRSSCAGLRARRRPDQRHAPAPYCRTGSFVIGNRASARRVPFGSARPAADADLDRTDTALRHPYRRRVADPTSRARARSSPRHAVALRSRMKMPSPSNGCRPPRSSR